MPVTNCPTCDEMLIDGRTPLTGKVHSCPPEWETWTSKELYDGARMPPDIKELPPAIVFAVDREEAARAAHKLDDDPLDEDVILVRRAGTDDVPEAWATFMEMVPVYSAQVADKQPEEGEGWSDGP